MNKQQTLEMDRDTLLEYIETINAEIYNEIKEIEKLEQAIKYTTD